MKRLKLLILLLTCVIVSSCIPHKDTVYLQNKDNSLNDSLQNNLSEVQKPYRVQIADILNIRIKVLDQDNEQIFNPVGEDNLNASSAERAYFDGFTIDLHGNIRIPQLGEINVLGYTTDEIRLLLEKKLLAEQFKKTANIFVTVKLAGLRFVASGEVANPGSITLFQDRVNIFEAIANAGEIVQTGNRKEVMVIRQYPQGQKIHNLDLTDINVMKSPYYYIQHNDMIYVKPLKQKSWGTGITGAQTFTTLITVLGLLTTSVLLIDRL
ncbi:polysaccharide biosynthesis/export family protein [Winogradskyella sp. UBA3174]|uniref:polysaccharide biosynthesis/export family protein n=1 Tax=Winogradskyella sp. UBA3174 TaxID=1947785 RepID=UPI0025D52B7A|nr:polysaccharide biosynthesis/export family protein [Winogradskyella sp. UBA3174]|tara:strand:+ start:53812 stop:54612 length:801 start_codon:yes stop_codon:yes gene_type:complete